MVQTDCSGLGCPFLRGVVAETFWARGGFATRGIALPVRQSVALFVKVLSQQSSWTFVHVIAIVKFFGVNKAIPKRSKARGFTNTRRTISAGRVYYGSRDTHTALNLAGSCDSMDNGCRQILNNNYNLNSLSARNTSFAGCSGSIHIEENLKVPFLAD